MAAFLPYLQFARMAFQRRAAYRLANWTGFAVNFFFFLVHAQVLLAFFAGRPAAGWQPDDAVLYFAASESLLMVVGIFPDWKNNLAERIRTGEVGVDLSRPVSLYWRDVAERFGSGAYHFLLRALGLYALSIAVYGVAPPLRLELVLFPLSLGLGIAVCATLNYIATTSAFWRDSASGELSAVVFAHAALGGVFVPLDFYPEPLRALCMALPFRASIYTPVKLLTGLSSGPELALDLLHQLVWLALLAAIALALTARGERRLAVQGG